MNCRVRLKAEKAYGGLLSSVHAIWEGEAPDEPKALSRLGRSLALPVTENRELL